MELPAGLLGISSGWAIVAYGVLAIIRGQLVPRRTVDDVRRERDTWHEAHTVSEEARHTAQQQVGELVELSRTGVHALSSLPRAGEVTTRVPTDRTPAPPTG